MFLSKIHIQYFRGIKELEVFFDEKVNVIIGPNGKYKTTLIDAIRLFYCWGDSNNELNIVPEDFHREITETGEERITKIFTIEYTFEDLTDSQTGAFYQYLFFENDRTYARVTIEYTIDENNHIHKTYFSGLRDSQQKADYETFQLFRAYYLSALRDCTKDLMNTRRNLLGQVIRRKIEKNKSEETIKQIIQDANSKLLQQEEVQSTKEGINNNLTTIFHQDSQQIGLEISQHRVEYIVNVIKPFLQQSENNGVRCSLWENSLGYNNLIYIATVLSDISDYQEDDKNSLCALFIEEPEAHLHPQLQLNLYDFIRLASQSVNTQVFITTHSPTLTSRVPLDNLILLNDRCVCIGNCFNNRHLEKIISDVSKKSLLTDKRVLELKNMLTRYLDVTKSQLFFSKGVLFVEGISEALLMDVFSKIINKPLCENEIEIVNTSGVAFHQFIMLFNSTDCSKKVPINAAFITDGDEFTDSKNPLYSLNHLVENNYEKLIELKDSIQSSKSSNRVANMESLTNCQDVVIAHGLKTLEFEISYSNVSNISSKIYENALYKYLKMCQKENIDVVDAYLTSLKKQELSDDDKFNVAILIWKSMPPKSEFAQDFSTYLECHRQDDDFQFNVPQYISDAICSLTTT